MVWKKPEALAAKTPVEFTFELLDADGKPPAEMALSMAMSGYTAFVKSDGSVFAHLHPSGTVSMHGDDGKSEGWRRSRFRNERYAAPTKIVNGLRVPSPVCQLCGKANPVNVRPPVSHLFSER